MFRANVNGKTIKFRFHYQYTSKDEPNNKFKNCPIGTTVTAYDEKENILGRGQAICSVKEKICSKRIGRKISLARLIKLLYPENKANRKLIWNKYFRSINYNF